MSDTYRRPYVEGSVYSNVVDLVSVHRASGGKVVVDLGCGFGAIAEPIATSGSSTSDWIKTAEVSRT